MKQEELLMQHVDLLNERMDKQVQEIRKLNRIIDTAKKTIKHFKYCKHYIESNGAGWVHDFERELGEDL